MPSTYSPNLRIELIGTGEQAGTWGTTTNTNLGTLIEDAIAGYVSVSVTSADQALTALNGAADQSRNMTINLTTTTTANFNVYIPPAEKFYVIRNTTAYTATIYCSTVLGNTTAAGAGVTVLANTTTVIFSDATNVREAINSFPGNLVINGSVGIGGAASSARSLYVQSTALTGTIQIGVDSRPVFTSGATGAGYGIISSPATAAASFTQANLYGIGVLDATKGAGSTITNQFGIRIFDQTQGGTANYGLFMDVSSGSDKWNIYASGTANNYFAGAVLVGTTASQTLAGTTGNIQIETPNSASNITVVRNTANTSGPIFAFGKSRGGALGSRTAVTSGDLLGAVVFNGADGTNMIAGAAIYAQVEGTVSAGVMPTNIQFYTENAAGTFAERVRISPAGNVGFTTTPSPWSGGNSLDIVSAAFAGVNALGTLVTWNTYWDGTNWRRKSASTTRIYTQDSANHTWSVGASGASGASYTPTTQMTLDVNGYLTLNASEARYVVSPSTGTNSALLQFTNTGGTAYVGLDRNTPGLGGQYVLNLWHSGNYAIDFATNDTRRMRLTAAGLLGIGTTNPGANLEIYGSGELLRLESGTSASKTMYFRNTGVGNTALILADGTLELKTNSSSPIEFTVSNTTRGRFDTSGNFQFNSGYGSVAIAYGVRAWVNFNGTGTVAIRASANVTSITDNGVGDYTVNITTAMPDANYAVAGCSSRNPVNNPAPIFGLDRANPTTTAVNVQTANTANVREDGLFCMVIIVR